jgi:hypothetical protein
MPVGPAHLNRVGGTEPAYRPEDCLRQPHRQLVCSHRQALPWHPQEQEEQSHVPQQLVFATFCEVVCLTSAMMDLLGHAGA